MDGPISGIYNRSTIITKVCRSCGHIYCLCLGNVDHLRYIRKKVVLVVLLKSVILESRYLIKNIKSRQKSMKNPTWLTEYRWSKCTFPTYSPNSGNIALFVNSRLCNNEELVNFENCLKTLRGSDLSIFESIFFFWIKTLNLRSRYFVTSCIMHFLWLRSDNLNSTINLCMSFLRKEQPVADSAW